MCHIAPVDFIVRGLLALFEDEPAPSGSVFALMDPRPVTYNRLIDLICERWGKHKPILRLPPAWMNPIANNKLFEYVTGIPWKAFMYASQPIEYHIEKSTAALARHGIQCPAIDTYMDVLVRYYQAHCRDNDIRRERWWEKR